MTLTQKQTDEYKKEATAFITEAKKRLREMLEELFCPNGKISDYFVVRHESFAGIRLMFYSHTYEYEISATLVYDYYPPKEKLENEWRISIEVENRKSIAGTTNRKMRKLATNVTWIEIGPIITKNELVKIAKQESSIFEN